MRLPHFFIDRPIFATVLAVLITLLGAVAYLTLPVAQYPEIAPPTIQVHASYPGASAEVVSDTVATPLEQEINGVEHMLYMSSQATGDGQLDLQVTFALGTDLDTAQVLVQNRVAIAEPRLPDDVRRIGVTVRKSSPDLMMVIHLSSPDNSRDLLYISNYATLQIRDELARLDGVGDVRVFSARDYAMRIWLDPDRIAARGLTAGDVVAALRGQNVQVASGVLNQPPVPHPSAFQINVETLGRLQDVRQFENIIVRSDPGGRVTRVRDIGRVELGAQDYTTIGYLETHEALPLLVFQRPGSNALATAKLVKAKMAELSHAFPPGLVYSIVYNPTDFIQQSVDAVTRTIFEAVVLVVLVVVLFLQTWRASIIPIVAIPVSLIGTFIVLAAFGYSLNNLSLFGLVLAIGIVVDDAIVVVENVERNLRAGMSPRDAAHETMDEVAPALVAIAMVLAAVFIPAALIPGISGQFFRQFAVTIAAATLISCFVSLTLSPALCAILFKPHVEARQPPFLARPFVAFFRGFNAGFDRLSAGYGGLTRRLGRVAVLVVAVYAGLLALTGWQFGQAPTGFIPQQDQGYLITVLQLPPGASLSRTDAVVRRATAEILKIPGVAHAVPFAGFDGATFTNAPNSGAIFSALDTFENREKAGRTIEQIIGEHYKRLGSIQDAFIITIPPPPVRGIGNAGGFKMIVEDRRGRGPEALEAAVGSILQATNQDPALRGVFSLFNTRTPKLYADIDRVKSEMLGVPADRVFEALEVYLGSAFVNEFNYLGRTYRVTAQADGAYRQDVHAVENLKTRNTRARWCRSARSRRSATIPAPIVCRATTCTRPPKSRAPRRPAFRPARPWQRWNGSRPNSCQTGFAYEWTELALQEKLAGNTGLLVFAAAACSSSSAPRRPVRKLVAAARGRPDRADVPAAGRQRPALAGHGREHPGAGRLRGPDRARRQERDPDRGVRASGRGRGQGSVRGGNRRRADAAAPDPDDVVRLHPWRGAAGDRERRRRRDAPVAGHRRVLRHAGRHAVRAHLHAGLLRRCPRPVRPFTQGGGRIMSWLPAEQPETAAAAADAVSAQTIVDGP